MDTSGEANVRAIECTLPTLGNTFGCLNSQKADRLRCIRESIMQHVKASSVAQGRRPARIPSVKILRQGLAAVPGTGPLSND